MKRVRSILISGVFMFVSAIIIDGQPAVRPIYHYELAKEMKRIKTLPWEKSGQMKSINYGIQKPDSLIWETWDWATSSWTFQLRQLYSYDAYGNRDAIDYTWDTILKKWTSLDQKITTYYNWSGNETENLSYAWDKSKRAWKLLSKTETAYDGLGNVTFRKSYYLEYYTAQMIEYMREDYNLDGSGRTKSSLIMVWDATSGGWINNWKTEYSYYESGKASCKSYTWDNEINQWVPLQWTEYKYDSRGRITAEIFYGYHESIFQWVADSKTEYFYDSLGNESYILYYYFDNSTNLWIAYEKLENIYNQDGKLLFTNNYLNDELTGQMELAYSCEFGYDSRGNNTTQTYSYNDMTTGETGYTWRSTKYYSEQQVISETSSINVYPNPASEYVVFDIGYLTEPAHVDIFGSNGNRVGDIDLFDYRQVSVSHYPSGLYFYRLYLGTKTYSGKIVVQ